METNTREHERWLGSLDADVRLADLAGDAAYSPAQFFRLVRKSLSGSPMAIRRRLLMERAAYELTRTPKSVTEIAFDAAYGSLEGFGRAFRRAYRVSPSQYRRLSPTDYRLGAEERLHFAPSDRAGQGATAMHTLEQLIEHHVSHMGEILDCAATWSDAELDREMRAREPFPWCDVKATFRSMLGAGAAFAAPWMHAINGIDTPYAPKTIAEMREALARGRLGFIEILRTVERDRSWDLTFVDSICEPPEVFSYGGVIGHVITFNDYRRYALVNEMLDLGCSDLRFTCPMSKTSVA